MLVRPLAVLRVRVLVIFNLLGSQRIRSHFFLRASHMRAYASLAMHSFCIPIPHRTMDGIFECVGVMALYVRHSPH